MTLCLDAALIGPWVCQRAGGSWVKDRGTAIGRIDNGQLIAGVLYEDWNGANLMCHIAGEGNWANREFLGVIFDYPFNQVGAKRITAPVSASNFKSINMLIKMGFALECTLTQATPDGDLHLFRMWRDDCKYIRGKYALPRPS